MAFTASETTVSQLFQSSFGRPVSSQEGLTAWVERYDAKVTAGSSSAEAEQLTLAEMNLSDESTAIYVDKDEAATVDFIFTNSLGRTAVEPGRTAWVERAATISLDQLQQEILASARTNDDFDYMNDLVQEADDALNGEVVNGDAISLTSSTDRGGDFDGTADSDTFLAYIQQNAFAGGVSNSLSSADRLDGGAGTDTLTAEIIPEFFGVTGENQIDVQPQTVNIEKVTFEAREINFDGYNNNDSFAEGSFTTVDAKYMTEVKEIGSKMSDGDLKIENLTTLKDGTIDSVSSMTITMDHTDNMNSDNDASDLTVLFDEDYLTPTTSFGQSGIEFKMMNQDAYDANGGADRLDGVYVRKMVVTLEGVEYDLAQYIQEDGETGLGAEFKTETDLVAHLNAVVLPALKADHPEAATAMESLIFTIGDTWNDANQNRIGDIIVLSVSNEFSLSIGSTDLELAQAENVPNDYASNRIERADAFDGANTESISVNVMLDKVGRDGEGGNLVVGAKNQDRFGDTDVDQTDGIPTINVTVNGDEERPSNLGRITSTNDELLNVSIASESRTDGSYAALTVRGESGDLDMQGGSNPFGGTLESLSANSFLGDLAIGEMEAALNIDTFTATGGGDVTLFEDIDGSEQANYMVATGTGDDSITVDLDGDAVDSLQTGLTIATGAGDDMVTVTGEGGVSDATTLELNNLSIATGTGEDTISVNAEHIYRVNAGANSDFVVVDANNSIINGTTGAWSIGDGTDALDTDWVDTVLYEATLTVDFAGFTKVVKIATNVAGNFIATQEDINNAVIAAIEASPELARLLEATATTGSSQSQLLTIVSTVQGVNDLTIKVNQPTVVLAAGAGAGATTVSASEYAAIEAGLIATGEIDSSVIPTNTEAQVVAALNANSGNLNETGTAAANDFVLDSNNTTGPSTAVDGTNNTTATSNAIINMSTGANDLVVLDSDSDSSDTIVFSAVWGKVSVVNFFDEQFNTTLPAVDGITAINHTIADEVIGLHNIDFTAWLDDKDTTSGSAASALRTDTTDIVTVANAIDLSDNEVTIVNNFAQNLTETWAAMTAADVDAALTGAVAADDYGLTGAVTAISDATTTVLAVNGLLGTSIDSILMVENDRNDGEYKAFNVETTNVDTVTEAFTVTLLGVIDFGETIDASAVFA